MNVLLVLSQLEVTGAEVYAVQLADELIARGHSVIIVSDTLTKPTRAGYVPMDLNTRTPVNRIRHIRRLAALIRRERIDIVHANSRASAWVSGFAARRAGVPMVVTAHGRAPGHTARRIIKAFGDRTIAVCENIADDLTERLRIPASRIDLIRNGVKNVVAERHPDAGPPVIALIGRLSGPKGEIAYDFLTKVIPSFPDVRVLVAGGTRIPDRFRKLPPQVELLGYVENVGEVMERATVVVGAGQVAMKALSAGIPTVALGEACTIGLVTSETLEHALASNFGDIADTGEHDWEMIRRDLTRALAMPGIDEGLRSRAAREFGLSRMVELTIATYRRALGWYYRREIPVLTYHRVIDEEAPRGHHGIWVSARRFEWQLRYLRRAGFRIITFAEYLSLPERERYRGRHVVLTFDDGYRDNYETLFPILHRHGARAVIFQVTDRTENIWDQGDGGEPPLPLMDRDEIRRMVEQGMEFGSHTLTHPRLTELSSDEARREITESKRRIEEITGTEAITFCYPYGALDATIKEHVRAAGYRLGIASDSGPLAMLEDPFELRRIQVFPGTGKLGFIRKVSGRYLFKKKARG